MRISESRFLARALKLDKFTGGIHHQIQVHGRPDILGIAQVQQWDTLHNADADRGNTGFKRTDRKFFFFDQFADRERKGHEGTCNSGGARAAIGLQHIAIHTNRAGSEFFQIHGGPNRPADQPLDFRRTPIEAPLGNIAGFAGQGGVRKHRIFGGYPAAFHFLFFHPPRDRFLNSHGANQPGVTPFTEGRTGGVRRNMVLKAQRADLVGSATIGANSFWHTPKSLGKTWANRKP